MLLSGKCWILFCVYIYCDKLIVSYAQDNQNQNVNNNNNENVFKRESYRLPVQGQDNLGSYNEDKKVLFKQSNIVDNNIAGSHQGNVLPAGSQKRSSKLKRGKKKRLIRVKDGKSKLKFNEIARNADGGGDVGVIHDAGGIQQSINVVDYGKKMKDPQGGLINENRINQVTTTPYNAAVINKEYNRQFNKNDQKNDERDDHNKNENLQGIQRSNLDLKQNMIDKNEQTADTGNNQNLRDKPEGGYNQNSNRIDNGANLNSYQKHDNSVNQNAQQRTDTDINQNVQVKHDTGVNQNAQKRTDTDINQNVQVKPDTGSSQHVQQKSDTGANQNAQQKSDTGANQNAQQKSDTGSNQNVQQKSDTGANQNAQQKSDTGANQNAQQKSDTGANQNSLQGSNTGVNQNSYQRSNTGVNTNQWKGFGDGFSKGLRRSPDDNRLNDNPDIRRGPPKRSAFPKGKSRPDIKQREDVQWMEEYHSFSLRASVDNRFRIRYAPIPKEGSPWPLPQFYRPESTQYMIKAHNLKFNAAGETCDILEFAFDRIKKNMFGKIDSKEEGTSEEDFHFLPEHEESPYTVEIKNVNVTVLRECGLFPQLEMDESYDLEIRKSGAVIIAREIWGAIRGLETFSQLVYQDSKSIYVVNRTLIHDFPRFKHRGILLDTSRHYLNKETIILNLEAMAQNKMNVFHWHIVDEQSFPFDSHTYPNLTKMGAYSPSHIYTHEVIKQIINEARLRGIRVVPEFDTPGHTFAWGFGQDNLLTQCYSYAGQPDGYFGPVNPILKSTYRFLNGLFAEVLGLFKDKYVHLGGDEVSLDCWQTNPYLQRFMSRNKLYDVKDLLNVYERKLCDIIAALGKQRKVGSGYITWQEVFDDGVQLKPDAIVQIWKGDAWDIDRVTNRGYRALFSTCWYLDYINYGQDWDKYYKCEQIGPHLEMYNVRNESLLLGGDVCLWTEFADDENILPRLWPRASAAAERLWSHKDVMDAEAAAPRIEAHRCRMKSRGIPVGVLSGPGYCKKHSKKSATVANLFDWVNQKAENIFNTDKRSNTKNIYVVDMNAMYFIPLILVVCLVCVVILSSVQQSPVQKKFLTIITFPVSGTRRSVKGLIYVFMIFAVIWCIWTAPIWLHTWESNNKLKK